MPLKLLGGGSTLDTVVSDMNSNLLTLMPLTTNIVPSVVASGTATGTAVAGSTVFFVVAHSLNYAPQANVYVQTTSTTYKPLPATMDIVATGATVTYATLFEFFTTSSFLFIYMHCGTGSTFTGTRTFKYELLSTTAN